MHRVTHVVFPHPLLQGRYRHARCWTLLSLVPVIALSLNGLSRAQTSPAASASPQTAPAATQAAASQPAGQRRQVTNVSVQEDGQWTMPGKNYQGTRFSGLDQIKPDNAKNLRVAWTFSLAVIRGQEAATLVVNNTMYVVTGYPNYLYALDATTGAFKWKYDPHTAAAAQGVACCDVVNRGCFYDNGRIYYNNLDCHTICVDAGTGKELWKQQVGNINIGESMTMAPLVVKGKVLVGNSGGEFGVRGWLKALDANDGHVVWTAYSTGPDAECLIGPDFKPFYPSDQGKDLGVTTWPPEHWKLGGGTVWGWVTYDPELDLVFYGTSNPGVWNAELRPGDNKWGATVFARHPDTGQAAWAYQYTPHDLFDHDEINEHLVLDLPLDGAGKPLRKVIVHPGRNGFIYVIDRKTGQVLSATKYTRNTIVREIDLKTGRPVNVDEKTPQMGKVIRDVQPASPGAKDWQPTAWSPRTGLLYIPHQNLACDYETVEVGYIAGTPFVGVNERMYAGADDPEYRGYYTAWDPVACKIAWRLKEKFPVWSGTMVTAGDVAFYGTMDGYFKAIDARDGKSLWQFKTGSGIIGQPVTYRGSDGKQYVAVLSGVGGWSGAVVAGDLDTRDPTSALGFTNAMKDLPQHTTKGGDVYVFALP